MRRTLFALLAAMVLLAPVAQAQKSIRDSTIAMTVVSLGYAYQIPGGDMAMRFGANSNINLHAARKFSSNYLLGVEGGFIFGDKVREPGLLRNMITREGQIVDQEGRMADVLLYQRGWSAMVVGGKIIPVAGPNPNSGLMLKVGLGYLRHKIRIQTQENEVPQIQGDYLEGYDRLSAGPLAMVYVGYQNFANRGRINFHVGWEMMAAFTEPLRAFNFDIQRADSGTRFDALNGLRAGWSLPIYKKRDDRYHFW